MAKLKFGAWIPTYAWGDRKPGPENVRRIRASIEKCEKHGIDVWDIDHLLSAPGLYGHAWLEPLNMLAYAAALTERVKIATGILVLPVRHPVVLAKEISTLCHISNNRFVWGVGPGWYTREFEVTGSRIQERGRPTDQIINPTTLLPPPPPRPPLGGDLGEGAGAAGPHPGRARRARAGQERDGPDRARRPLALPLLGQAGLGEAGLGPDRKSVGWE